MRSMLKLVVEGERVRASGFGGQPRFRGGSVTQILRYYGVMAFVCLLFFGG